MKMESTEMQFCDVICWVFMNSKLADLQLWLFNCLAAARTERRDESREFTLPDYVDEHVATMKCSRAETIVTTAIWYEWKSHKPVIHVDINIKVANAKKFLISVKSAGWVTERKIFCLVPHPKTRKSFMFHMSLSLTRSHVIVEHTIKHRQTLRRAFVSHLSFFTVFTLIHHPLKWMERRNFLHSTALIENFYIIDLIPLESIHPIIPPSKSHFYYSIRPRPLLQLTCDARV